ncbi:hypothetical protein BH18ACT10_BH18ACT10_05760 [soil metagenome]|nr:hypothetical protein [Rubrobacter sp.]
MIPKWGRIWIAVAGTALFLGGIAWLAKLSVVVATDGRVTATGAAGAFFTLGLALILIGSTGAGLRLTMGGEPMSRIAGIVLSPVLFVAAFMILQGVVVGLVTVAQAIVGGLGPDYVREEAIILLTAVVSLVVGTMLLAGAVRWPRGATPQDPEPVE